MIIVIDMRKQHILHYPARPVPWMLRWDHLSTKNSCKKNWKYNVVTSKLSILKTRFTIEDNCKLDEHRQIIDTRFLRKECDVDPAANPE
jgi:hypothetical protein